MNELQTRSQTSECLLVRVAMTHGTLITSPKLPSNNSMRFFWVTNITSGTFSACFSFSYVLKRLWYRIDQLASIILNHHLPFFRFFPTPDRPLSKELVALHHSANRLWETEMVDATTDTETFTVSRIE